MHLIRLDGPALIPQINREPLCPCIDREIRAGLLSLVSDIVDVSISDPAVAALKKVGQADISPAELFQVLYSSGK